MIIFFNTLLVLSAIFFLYLGVRIFIRFKGKGFWTFLTFLMFAFLCIGVTEVKTTTIYQEPAAMTVKDGTLVVIDSNKVVRYIHNYERGIICLETRLHERMIPIFNERFVSINTECQNKLK